MRPYINILPLCKPTSSVVDFSINSYYIEPFIMKPSFVRVANSLLLLDFILQIMALIVTVVGLTITMTFQILIREDPDAKPPKMKWTRWFKKAQFYLV